MERNPVVQRTLRPSGRRAAYLVLALGLALAGSPLFTGCANLGSPPGYFAPEKIPTLPPGEHSEFLPDRLTKEAVKFITANKDRPFFLDF